MTIEGDACPKCIEGKMEERIVWQLGLKKSSLSCTWCGHRETGRTKEKQRGVHGGQIRLF